MKTVNVVAAIIVSEGKVLATRRGYGEYKDGWECPGGKIEPGESPEAALVREISEELDAMTEARDNIYNTFDVKVTIVEMMPNLVPALHEPEITDAVKASLEKRGIVVKTGSGISDVQVQEDGTVKSSVDKFYNQDVLQSVAREMQAEPGDLLLILSGDDAMKTRKQLSELRLEMGRQLGLRDPKKFSCLWVIDFPMYEWSDEEQRLMAMHHPFTSPKPEDIPLLDSDPASVRANAYDMVINGVEVGGGSIRIHDAQLQEKIFEILGFTPEQAQAKFGFLMNAFKYGAPPHGGLAYGLDRFVSLFAGLDSIRDCIAFPKNNQGRDVMLGAPGPIDQIQLDELMLDVRKQNK